jgi:endonuclease YncB( thermonuclease family)
VSLPGPYRDAAAASSRNPFLVSRAASRRFIASALVDVLDGDTIRVDERRPDVRLAGFNAPETTRGQCAAERDLGEVAARRLRQLVPGVVGLFEIRRG